MINHTGGDQVAQSLNEYRRQPIIKMVLIALIGLIFMRFVVLTGGNNALFYDEAYYHLWSTTLDWGYYSKPPMVAWLIHVTTSLLGHSEWAVRLAAPLCYLGASFFILALVLRVAHAAAAFWAWAFFISMPLISFNSLFITTDAPLMLCWAACSFFAHRAFSHNQWRDWLATAIFAGLGLLSKYTMGVLAIGLLIYLLLQNTLLHHLCNKKFWISLLLAVLIFAPNLWWNAEHHFISFQHTSEISHLNHEWFHFDQLAEFFFGQLIVFGLLSFPLVIWFISKRRILPALSEQATAQAADIRFALCISLPMLIVICIQAFLARAHVNWAAPTFIGFSMLLAMALTYRQWYRTAVWVVLVNTIVAMAFYAYPSIQQTIGIEPTRKNTPYHRIQGYREITQSLTLTRSHIISDSRSALSYLHYYGQGYHQLNDYSPLSALTLYGFDKNQHIEDHYELKYALPQQPVELSAHYLSVTPLQPGSVVHNCFDTVKEVGRYTTYAYPTLKRQWYLYDVDNFLGYEQCLN